MLIVIMRIIAIAIILIGMTIGIIFLGESLAAGMLTIISSAERKKSFI